MYACAECGRAACCESPDTASYPRGCPSREPFETEVLGLYREGQDAHLARNAALVEAGGYCRLTRIEEIMDFARRCGYTRLGLAFCIGLQDEAAVAKRVLRGQRLLGRGSRLQDGSLPKEVLGLGDDDKVRPGSSRACATRSGRRGLWPRPAPSSTCCSACASATTASSSSTPWRPVTVLAAKDRVLGHNPLAAIYLADGYYHDRLFPKAGKMDGDGT